MNHRGLKSKIFIPTRNYWYLCSLMAPFSIHKAVGRITGQYGWRKNITCSNFQGVCKLQPRINKNGKH